tara:strand:- start:152 stop:580 length:429 start_codon:yes stop_codon:yes gene_type:complete
MKKLKLNCDDDQKLSSNKDSATLVKLTPFQQEKMNGIIRRFDWTEVPTSAVMRVAACMFINKFYGSNVIKGTNTDFQNIKDINKNPEESKQIIKESNKKIDDKKGSKMIVTKKLLRDIANHLGGVDKLKEKLDSLKEEEVVS